MRYIIIKQSHYVYLVGKPIIPHLRRYQGFAVVHYSVTLDALYPGHPRLSLNRVTVNHRSSKKLILVQIHLRE